MKTIALDKIRIDGGTQMRAEINRDVVKEYVEKMEAGEKFPPVDAFDDGENVWLADGFHRYHAAVYKGDELIAADVRQGTLRDAILFAVGANGAHGLPRTNADKRRAVEALLADAEWQRNSATWLAEKAGVSVPFASQLKQSLLTVNSGSVLARDGRTMNTTNIGRKDKTVINGDTGEVIDNAMVETVTMKPFKKDESDESQDTGIGHVYRGNTSANNASAGESAARKSKIHGDDLLELRGLLGRLKELTEVPSMQLSPIAIRRCVAEIISLVGIAGE